MNAIGFDAHNHSQCIDQMLVNAERHCARENLQFTAIRRRVLEILLQEHKALGAYDVLEVLSADGVAAQPPVAYRALNFLVEHGLAHRVERLNAYAACAHLGQAHAPIFLICRACRLISESDGALVQAPLETAAQAVGFAIERVTVEIEGLCPTCTETTP